MRKSTLDHAVIQFGKRLCEIRTARGLSQAALAKKSGVRQNQISRLETGPRLADYRELIALADALAVAQADLSAAVGAPIPGVTIAAKNNT